MHERIEFDLRIATHQQRTEAINRHAWQSTATPPAPAPRRTLAKLLLTLATRLDPSTAAPAAEAAPPAPLAF